MSRNAYLLLAGFAVSEVGNWIYRLALPLLVYEMTGSPLAMATVVALEYAPYVLFSLLGGVAADSFDRRRLLMAGDLASAGVVCCLAVALWAGAAEAWMVFGVAFLLGGVAPFHHPTFQSLLPSLTSGRSLAGANGLFSTVESVLGLAGPLAGGAGILLVGTANAMAMTAASFAVSALAVAAIRTDRDRRPRVRRTGIARQVAEGVGYLRRDTVLLAGALVFMGTNFSTFLIQANLVYYLAEVRGFDTASIGIAFAGQGGGAMVGALVAPALGRRAEPGRLILACTVLAGGVMLLLLAARGIAAVTLVLATVSLLTTVNVVTWFTLRQRIVPREILGRVVAITRMLAFAAIPAAALVGGGLLAALGSAYPLILLAALLRAGFGVAGLFTPLGRRVAHAS